MYYKIKAKDTLSKIAKAYQLPVELILAHNPSITNPNSIYVNQLIYIPNTDDVPSNDFSFTEHNADSILTRASSAIGKSIHYKLGSGGIDPLHSIPTKNKLCDCSGFVCWIFGLSRKTDIPFYKKFGGWIYTDSMVADINSAAGIFENLSAPEEGCIVVYGAGKAIGHVGIVSKVVNGQMQKVIHCSSGNDKTYKDSIRETTPKVFNRADTLWGRFVS
jgi:LysM repeat protein